MAGMSVEERDRAETLAQREVALATENADEPEPKPATDKPAPTDTEKLATKLAAEKLAKSDIIPPPEAPEEKKPE
jgi:hypothetical protein